MVFSSESAAAGRYAAAESEPHPQRPLAVGLERIAVFRALHFGDLLCAVPALRALRAAQPQARITLVGLPWARTFAARFARYVDDFLPFPGGFGLNEGNATPERMRAYLRAARARRFDLALQLHGSGAQSNRAVAALGARAAAGFHPPDEPNPDPRRFVPYPEEETEVRRMLHLLRFLGAPAGGEELEFPIFRSEWRQAALRRAQFGLRPGGYVCIHPGARAPARRWPPERFAQVATQLAARGLQVVLTGTAEEAALTAAVARATPAPCVDLAGRAHGGVLAALLAGARLLVCNDTAVSHMAAALHVPSVVVYLASAPARWAPADRARHRRVFRDVACRPCVHWVCPIGHPCAEGVSARDVLREVEELSG